MIELVCVVGTARIRHRPRMVSWKLATTRNRGVYDAIHIAHQSDHTLSLRVSCLYFQRCKFSKY